jgi:hypothetical protein
VTEDEPTGWELVARTAHKAWSLANDGFEIGDESQIKEHMSSLLAEAQRNGVDVVSQLEGRIDD